MPASLHKLYGTLHLWLPMAAMELPSPPSPVSQPPPLQAIGAPNFRQGAGRLPFPNPCHALCCFCSPFCFHSKCMGTARALSPCIHCGYWIRATHFCHESKNIPFCAYCIGYSQNIVSLYPLFCKYFPIYLCITYKIFCKRKKGIGNHSIGQPCPFILDF